MLEATVNNIPEVLAQLKRRYVSSFKSHLIAGLLGLSLSFLWALVFFSVAVQRHQFSEVLFDQQFASVQRLAADLDSKLKERIHILGSVAEKLPDGLAPAALDAYLAQLSGLHSTFSAGIAIIGLDGKAIADYPVAPGRRGVYFGDRDYFTQVAATRKPYIDKPVIDRALKHPVLVIGVPISDSAGNFRGVMIGITDLTAPNFLGSVSEQELSGKGEFWVISPLHNVIVAATDAKRVMTAPPMRGTNLMYDRFVDGFEGSGTATSTLGELHLFSGKYVPTAQWLVVEALPTDVAFRPVTAMQNRLMIAAGILTLLAMLLTYWVARHMCARLDKIGQTMQRMKEGTAQPVPLPVNGGDEMDRLLSNFNVLIEENHRSEAALAASEQRFRMLVEHAPDAIVVQTRGRFAYVNTAAMRLLGAQSKEQLLDQAIIEIIPPRWREMATASVRLINERRENIPPREVKLLRLDGTVAYVEISAIPYYYENEHGALVFARDITERKRAANELRESEERFQRLLALSTEWYWEQDEHYRFTRISGWPTEQARERARQFIGHTRWDITPGIDEAIWKAHRATLEARLPFWDFEYVSRTPEGHIIWYSLNGEPLFNDNGIFKGYHGTGSDITKRKLADEALHRSRELVRELAAHQEKIKEEERRRIARDIHDDLGQTLLALRLDVSMFAQRVADCHPRLHNKVSTVLHQLDTTMKNVRTIINDLRPSVLDLGLLAAMEWQVREFQRRNGIACELIVDDEDFDRYLDESRSAALFRIVQESLTNINRHAQASKVQILVRVEAGRLQMTIADNGVGMTANSRKKKNSFGLVGIEERIITLGGMFTIDSAPGQGTLLSFSLPVGQVLSTC